MRELWQRRVGRTADRTGMGAEERRDREGRGLRVRHTRSEAPAAQPGSDSQPVKIGVVGAVEGEITHIASPPFDTSVMAYEPRVVACASRTF